MKRNVYVQIIITNKTRTYKSDSIGNKNKDLIALSQNSNEHN